MKLTETYEWSHLYLKDDFNTIATTPEYWEVLWNEKIDILKAENILNKYGIPVKTEYGNYRPLVDVLVDILNKIKAKGI